MTQISDTAVKPAQPSYVTDANLRTMIGVANNIDWAGTCSEEGFALLAQNLGPCLKELLDHRMRAQASLELTPDVSPDNLLQFPPQD
ncbi:MAG: hypothetical protein AAFX07_00675 [Pseudomonadota bacterium]